VYGESADNHGVVGQGNGAGAGVVGLASSGYGLLAGSGHAGITDNTKNFRFVSAKTGVLFVPVTDLAKVSGSATLTVAAAPINLSYYAITDSASVRLVGPIRLPRGASITDVKAHFSVSNGASNYVMQSPVITRKKFDSLTTAMSSDTIMSSAGFNFSPNFIGFGVIGSVSAQPLSSGSASDANLSFVDVDWNTNTAPAGMTAQVAGLYVTYTYTTVDFMV
jgi:hypothetical protein